MFIASRIEQLIADNKLTKKNFCEKVSISVQGLDNILKGADLGSSKLERIADFFKLPIDYFFEREISIPKDGNNIGTLNGNGNKVQQGHVNVMQDSQEKEIEYLRTLLEEKERTIQILMNK